MNPIVTMKELVEQYKLLSQEDLANHLAAAFEASLRTLDYKEGTPVWLAAKVWNDQNSGQINFYGYSSVNPNGIHEPFYLKGSSLQILKEKE